MLGSKHPIRQKGLLLSETEKSNGEDYLNCIVSLKKKSQNEAQNIIILRKRQALILTCYMSSIVYNTKPKYTHYADAASIK